MKIDLQKDEQTEIIKIYNIISYQILSITITPNLSGLLEIMLFCDNNEVYSKKYLLIGKEYTDWLTDNYLDVFITGNLKKIFDN